MAGRHLRRGEGSRRFIRWALAALILGVLAGAGGAIVVDESDDDVATTTGPIAPATTTAASLVPTHGPITIAFVGDINVEGSLRQRLADDPETFVGPFADILAGADLAVGNLEAALTSGGTAIDKEYTFRAPPSILDALAAGGLDVVSVANNHGIDFGPDGLEETLVIRATDPRNMVIGVGADEDEAYAPFVRTIGGHVVAVIAATQVLDAELIEEWTATEDQAGLASAKRVGRLVDEVEAARETADTVVVFLHWGVETELCPSRSQQELANALVTAGADIVVGAHAHRVQGGGRLGDAVVHYGLGNFLFGAVSAESARTGVFLVDVDGREVLDYRWVPGRIVDRVPQPLVGEDADEAVAAWDEQRSCTDLAA